MIFMRRYCTLFIIVALISCSKEKTNPTPPGGTKPVTPANSFTVDFNTAQNTDVTSYTLNGDLQVSAASEDIEYGFIFSSYGDPSIYQGKVIGVGKSQKSISFSYILSGLDT